MALSDAMQKSNQPRYDMARKIIELLIDDGYSYAESERMLDFTRRMLKTFVPSKKRNEDETF